MWHSLMRLKINGILLPHPDKSVLIHLILSSIKHFSTLLSETISSLNLCKLILLFCYCYCLSVFLFTFQATYCSVSLLFWLFSSSWIKLSPGPFSVLCPIFSLGDIHTHLFEGHLCIYESYSYIRPAFEWCSYVAFLLSFLLGVSVACHA